MEAIGGYQLIREIGGWETRWFVYSAHKLGDPKQTEVVVKTCLISDLPPNPPQIPASIPAFLVASNHQREAAAQCKGIVPILASGSESGRVFHVTPRYAMSVQRLIESKVAVNDDGLENIADGILERLAVIQKNRQHSHGNLKPSNVFLEGSRNLAKAEIILADLAPREQSHTVVDDIHALGHVLHQLIRHRELHESFFPLQLSEEWNYLQGDATKWVHCINRFLDPALAQTPDPLKTARDALRTSNRDSAGGTIKQGAKAIKEVGSSKALQSGIWIALLVLLAVGGFLFIRHQQTNVDGAWNDVQKKNHLWLGSVSSELRDPKIVAIWNNPNSPQLRSVAEKVTRLLEVSDPTVQAVVKNAGMPTYSAPAEKDPYRLKNDKDDPDRVRKLDSDLAGIRATLGNYLPETDRARLRQFATHAQSAKWPVPDALTRAAAYDPSRAAQIGASISATLPLAPLLLEEDRVALLDRLAIRSAKVVSVNDPLLQRYLEGIREQIAILFKEPIDPERWSQDNGGSWRYLKRRDEGLGEIAAFLDGKMDRIAFDRFSEENVNSLSFPELDDPAFARRWIRVAEQYLVLDDSDSIRKKWTAEWAALSKNRSGLSELETSFKSLLARPKLVQIDQTSFDDLLGQLGFIPVDEAPVVAASTPPAPGLTPVPGGTGPNPATASAIEAYKTFLKSCIAQLSAGSPADVPGLATRFRSEASPFTSLSGVQDFLDQLTIDLTKKSSGGFRPKGFPAASRPNPGDAQLFNIPLPGRGSFPFRLISPPDGAPFFLGVWEVPIALLSPADFDNARADGPRFWSVAGGKLTPQNPPTWNQLEAEMVGLQGRVPAFFSPQVATVPGGVANWQRLPANFVNPTAAMRVATSFGLRLPTVAEWKAAYSVTGNSADGWLRGKTWRQQVDYIVGTVGARLQANFREGVIPTYPAVFPNARAYGSFDVSQKDDFDPAATQSSLFFRPTFTAANPALIKDMRGNVSEIATNGARFAVMGPSSLSSPKFTGTEGNPATIPAGESFSDVGFRFAVDAVPDSGTSNVPQLFANELQRVSP